MNFSTCKFMIEKVMVAKIMVENSGVEYFGSEMSCNHLKSDLPHDYVLGKPGVGSTAGATT